MVSVALGGPVRGPVDRAPVAGVEVRVHAARRVQLRLATREVGLICRNEENHSQRKSFLQSAGGTSFLYQRCACLSHIIMSCGQNYSPPDNLYVIMVGLISAVHHSF